MSDSELDLSVDLAAPTEVVPIRDVLYNCGFAVVPVADVHRPLTRLFWHPWNMTAVPGALHPVVVPVRQWAVGPGRYELAMSSPVACGAYPGFYTLPLRIAGRDYLALVHAPAGPVPTVGFVTETLHGAHCVCTVMRARLNKWRTRHAPAPVGSFVAAYCVAMGYTHGGVPEGLYDGVRLTPRSDVRLWATYVAAYGGAPAPLSEPTPEQILRAALGRPEGGAGVFEARGIIAGLSVSRGADSTFGLLWRLAEDVVLGAEPWTRGPYAASDILSLRLRLTMFGSYALLHERPAILTLPAAAPRTRFTHAYEKTGDTARFSPRACSCGAAAGSVKIAGRSWSSA
jgi:hypothetical protein